MFRNFLSNSQINTFGFSTIFVISFNKLSLVFIKIFLLFDNFINSEFMKSFLFLWSIIIPLVLKNFKYERFIMKHFILIKLAIISIGLSQTYDIVIKQGRVIDPETDLDQICNIGIIGNEISNITKKSINGKVTINAKGLVVSPGFIDLHAHGQTNSAHRY